MTKLTETEQMKTELASELPNVQTHLNNFLLAVFIRCIKQEEKIYAEIKDLRSQNLNNKIVSAKIRPKIAL